MLLGNKTKERALIILSVEHQTLKKEREKTHKRIIT
jgi:hypothetical protein